MLSELLIQLILSSRFSDLGGVEEAFELADASRVPHFAQRLGFDLPDAFAGHLELAADFLKGPAVAVDQSEALLQHLPLAFGECVEHVFDFFLQQHDRGDVPRIFRAFVLDEIAEAGVVAFADRGLQRDRLLRHLQHGADALDRQLDFLGDFLRRGLAAVFLDQLLLHPHQLVDRLDHVHRDADGARLIGDGAGDRLPNPPRGVGGKFVAAAILEFLDRFHQAHVAFLDQVEEGEAAVGVFLRDGNDEPQIGFDHFGFRPQRLAQPDFSVLVMLGVFVGAKARRAFSDSLSLPGDESRAVDLPASSADRDFSAMQHGDNVRRPDARILR